MVIIGHRGSKGTHSENTLSSLHYAIDADADMIEFDVRLTRDGIPVLAHDARLPNSRKRDMAYLRRYTLQQLQTATRNHTAPIATLEEVMHSCYGQVFLNIEIKELAATIPTIRVIERFVTQPTDWDSIMISSFKPTVLSIVRSYSPHASLALLQYRHPLAFIRWHELLRLDAIGFHRQHVSDRSIAIAKSFGLFTYTYTVNDPMVAQLLVERGVDGIVTDYPETMVRATKTVRRSRL